MTTFSQGFSSFIDNYILLLAARFNAPLDAASISGCEHDESWEKVSHCVRDVLLHPKTEAEKREVAHLDASLFDAQACRGHALYFQWRLQEEAATAATTIRGSAPPSERLQSTKKIARGHSSHAVAPSSFDITKDSLRDEVERIYTTVRMNLPSTLNLPLPSNEAATNCCDDDDGDVRLADDGEGDEEEGNDEVLAAVDFALRTKEEVDRDLTIAEARDVLLTKVQQMQAEFFAQHRRWVDVPLDMVLAPVPKKVVDRSMSELTTDAKAVDSQSLSKSALREAHMATNFSAALQKRMTSSAATENAAGSSVGPGVDSPTLLLEALRRSVHVNRPPRPSQMREEDYEADYRDVVDAISPSKDISMEARYDIYQKTNLIGGSRMPQENSRLIDDATRSTTVSISRANRWKVLEYDVEADEASDNTT
ncbi:hypothetical protein TraAM80_04313 [Trypanosoma rangeli]|uniref:Uncharacterized protein n=1 Tax=Trypanosoma rangeli TaxID=5698 RepID=A0A422NK60_TRYRA|nr:uncharacterized protein TraAM80_04313 [Trypanosoma rangeli]RNF05846.1 hypothetical protein TraAM80_04313 [Trypanosoma rangeli]|eukprot:RNF05846.1 hypothetical protein TraAM80_04313 [Trypanosoma rangeli]